MSSLPPPPPPPAEGWSSPEGSGGSAAGEPAAWSPPPPPPPSYTAEAPAAARPKRGKGRTVVTLIAAVIVLVGALGVVAAVRNRGNGPSNPQAAVDDLFTAIGKQDLIGVLDVLPKGEREVFTSMITDLEHELERLGVIAKGTNLRSIPGIQVSFSGLEYRTTELADDLAAVSVTAGKATITVNPAKLPLGSTLDDAGITKDRPDRTNTTVQDIVNGEPFEIATVKEGSSWRVSLFHSIAEVMRKRANEPVPEASAALAAKGGATPEAAVQALFEAIPRLDVRRMIELVDPEEGKALHRYAPLFIDDAEKEIQRTLTDKGRTIDVSGLKLDATGSGDRRKVTIKAATITAHGDEGDTVLQLEDDCITVTPPKDSGDSQKVCASDRKKLEDGDASVAGMAVLAGVSSKVPLEVVQRDGQWYLSPIGSMSAMMVGALASVDKSDLDKLISSFKDATTGLGSESSSSSFDTLPLDTLPLASVPSATMATSDTTSVDDSSAIDTVPVDTVPVDISADGTSPDDTADPASTGDTAPTKCNIFSKVLGCTSG